MNGMSGRYVRSRLHSEPVMSRSTNLSEDLLINQEESQLWEFMGGLIITHSDGTSEFYNGIKHEWMPAKNTPEDMLRLNAMFLDYL